MTNRPKILMYTAMYGRHDIFDIMYEGFKACRDTWEGQLDISLYVVASTDEDCQYLESKGIAYTVHENKPIGRKFSKGLHDALSMQWEYMMPIGSDDIIHPDLFGYYILEIEKGTKYFGTDSIVLMHPEKNRAKIFKIPPGNRIGMIGPGRMIHRSIVEHFDGHLWPAEDKGLTLYSNIRISNLHSPKVLTLQKEDGVLMFDIKSDENIWSYDNVIGCVHPSTFTPHFDKLPAVCKKLVDERRIKQTV